MMSPWSISISIELFLLKSLPLDVAAVLRDGETDEFWNYFILSFILFIIDFLTLLLR
jgi:hypothetical protein